MGSKTQVPIIEHADVRRQLLAQKALSEGALHLCFFAASLVDAAKTDAEAATLLDVLIPIVKAWPSEFALEANKWAIQVLGGYGYTRDYPVERLYRDNRLNMVHEGTNGIQALDLLGRKAVMKDGAATKALATAMAADVHKNAEGDLADLAADLGAAVERYGTTTALLGAELSKNPQRALANAHEYLNMVGHTVVAWLWLREASAAQKALPSATGADVPFYEGKIATARYFFRHELAKTRAQAELLGSLETSALDVRPGHF